MTTCIRSSVTFALLVLTACAEQPTLSASEIRERHIASLRQQCLAFGFVDGSEALSACMMQKDSEEKAMLHEYVLQRKAAQGAENSLHLQHTLEVMDSMRSRQPQITNCTPTYGGGVSCTTD